MNALLAALTRDLRSDAPGWAGSALTDALRTVTLVLIAAWQVVMIGAAVVSLGGAAWPLALLHAALGAAAALALTLRRLRRVPVWPLPLIMTALGVLDYVWSGELSSVLVFAACWQINFASCALGLILFRPLVIPLVMLSAAAVSSAVLAFLPEWGPDLPISVPVTQALIILALRTGLPALFGLARQVDVAEFASAGARERAEIVRRAGAQIADDSRVLHDTAINTLGAIANGGAGVAHDAQVRAQCARDAEVLSALQRNRAATEETGLPLRRALTSAFIAVQRVGLTDDEVEALLEHEDPRAVRAFSGAVQEILTNAAKHSGVQLAQVGVFRTPGTLVVDVNDDGVGYEPRAVEIRGLAHSVEARAAEWGFSVEYRAAPGAGTRVRLELPLGSEPASPETPPDSAERVHETTRALVHRAALLWAGGVTLVSVVLSAANDANYRPSTLVMLGVMVGTWFLAQADPARRPHGFRRLVLVLAPTVIFLCAAVTTDFGSTEPIHWQALAPTGPLVLVLSWQDRRAARFAFWVWAAVGGAVMCSGLPETSEAQAIVGVAGVVGLGFGIVWVRFQAAVEQLCIARSSAARKSFWARVEARSARAAQRSYQRWIAVGLGPALRLLRELADGRRDARSSDTRRACSVEERYLRHVIQIGPELVHLGPAVFPALRRAHDQGIALTLRLGDRDAVDHDTAQRIATEITRVLDAASASDHVTASLFPVRDGVQLTLVHDRRDDGVPDPDRPPDPSHNPFTAQFVFAGAALPTD